MIRENFLQMALSNLINILLNFNPCVNLEERQAGVEKIKQ